MIVPPVRKLMGPGPSDIHPQVLAALSQPTIGHLDPVFIEIMNEVKKLLQYAFQTDNTFTMPLSAPGSAGMEFCITNLLEPGEKIIVCVNGVFGGRMAENVKNCGAHPILVEDAWGTAVSLEKVEQAIAENPDATMLGFVHAETSTGARSDAKELCALAKKNNMLTLVDAVTSLAGISLQVDDWAIDAIYSGSQKCLSAPPGLSPISLSDTALTKIQKRTTPVQSWFLNANLLSGYWQKGTDGKRSYHHTAPVNMIYSLYQALTLLKEEGLQNSQQRHLLHHHALRAGLEQLGLTFIVDEEHRLPQLNAVSIPDGVDDAKVRATLLNDYQTEIGAGLGTLAGKVWRIGLMGYASRKDNVLSITSALENILKAQDQTFAGNAAGAATDYYSNN